MKFPNEDLYLEYQIVGAWWDSLDPIKQQVIKRSSLEQFFISKAVICEPKELDSVIRSYFADYQSGVDTTIKKSQFMRIVSCAIMRGILLNIHQFVRQTQGIPQEQEVNLSMKVMKLQRIILLNGIKAKSNIGIIKNGKVQHEGLS